MRGARRSLGEGARDTAPRGPRSVQPPDRHLPLPIRGDRQAAPGEPLRQDGRRLEGRGHAQGALRGLVHRPRRDPPGSSPPHPRPLRPDQAVRIGVDDRDNPETIRLKKYATGAHLLSEKDPVETGRTPKEIVWTKNKARLYRYEPDREKKHPVPVLLVYALILRPYILDLVPDNSLVEHLVGEGFDVYMLDWGIPGDEDRHLSFEHLVLDYLPRAVRKVLRASGAKDLTLFGYCQGGT